MSKLLWRLHAAVFALWAGSTVATAQDRQDSIDWINARADGSLRAFERYLERHPLGQHASEAFYYVTLLSIDPERAVGRIEPAAGPDSVGNSGSLAPGLSVY